MKLIEFAQGTYASLTVDKDCAEQLYAFCQEIGLTDLVDAGEYHCTVIYSKQPCPDVATENFHLPCNATPKGYKLLGTDNVVLVLEVACEVAEYLHELFMREYGALHDYESYIPHITLCNSYAGSALPDELPPFNIVFTEKTVEAIED